MLTKCASNYIKARPKWSHMPAFLLYNRPMGHREWSVGAGGKTTDSLPTTHTDGPLSVTHRLTCRMNKCLDSIRCHYTLSDICSQFLFVYGNNQHN